MTLKKHYFLLAALVVYQKDKLERTKPLNILITSETATVNRTQLGRAQQQAQVRFFTEFDAERKSNVVDVFVQSVSHLGEMSEAEFHGEFDYPGKPEAEVIEDTAQPVEEDMPTVTVTETPVENVTGADMTNLDPRFGTDDAGKQAQDRGE